MSLRKIYILTILLCSVWSVSRANAQSLAEQAGMAYQKGDYAKAVGRTGRDIRRLFL